VFTTSETEKSYFKNTKYKKQNNYGMAQTEMREIVEGRGASHVPLGEFCTKISLKNKEEKSFRD
jgi:hypothetical protein